LEDSMKFHNTPRACRPFLAGLSVVLTVVLISSFALAQSDAPNPKWDVFAGYQYLDPGSIVPAPGSTPSAPSQVNLPGMAKGIGGALTYNFDRHFGLEGDFGYNRGTSSGDASSEWTAGGGPRFIVRTDSMAVFIHALATFNRVTTDNGFITSNGIGIIAGGGLDVPFGKRFSWRVFGADYVWALHNFANYAPPENPQLRRPEFSGARLRTGVVMNWGGAPELVPAASCSVQPTEVLVGEPITASVAASNFNPKHTVAYSWSGNGGTVTGKDTAASIDTNGAAPGTYTVTAHVTDAKAKKNNEASCSATYTIKPLPPKNPPTMSCSASPSSVVIGGSASITCTCTSPDGVPVSVASWTATGGSVSGSGNTATLSTAGASAGSATVGATCTDSRGLTGQASTQVALENPPVNKLEARLALHSVYFIVNQPRPNDRTGGLLPSQQQTLTTLAADFKKYLENKPDAHLILGGHADHRGTKEYNQALSQRRVDGVKSFLVGQGVPEANIEVKAFGEEDNLTSEQVQAAVEGNPDLSTEERARIIKNINVVRMASNRRVDITLSTTGQSSAKVFPFNSTDALTLIGGREGARKAAPAKKPVKKQ
jgi:outer membrane protein OmpA-like peptidoglycan-associated protein